MAHCATAQVYPFRNYSIADGLSESVVNDIAQDANGYLWIATGYGLNRFDGLSFKNYFKEEGLQSNEILSLFIDNKEQVWVGTESGINVIRNDSIKTLSILQPLSSSSILAIYQGHYGEYWIGTENNGLWHLNYENILRQYSTVNGLANNTVRAIVEDSTGALWFGTANGLTRLFDGNFRSFTTADGLVANNIYDLAVDKNGALWIATQAGLSRLSEGQFTNFTQEDGLLSNHLRTVAVDDKSSLWIGTEEGLSHYENGKFVNYSIKDGLVNNIIYTIFLDREANVWFGTFGGGISLFLGKKFINYTIGTGLPDNMISAITADDKGNHWIGTFGGGLAKLNDGGVEVLGTEAGLGDDKIYTVLYDSKGRLLVGTEAGFSIYQNNHFTNYGFDKLGFKKVRDIEEVEAKNVYWLATYGWGAVKFKNGQFTTYTETDGLADNTALAVEEGHDGSIWFATYGGVSRLKDGMFTNFTIENGLPNNGVMDITITQSGQVWVSTNGGIARFKNEGFEAVTLEDGLPDAKCYFIIEGKPGIIWVGANDGVIRFDTQAYFRTTDENEKHAAFKLFTDKQGLVAHEMNAGAVYKDKNGVLWFGTVGGLTCFKPELFSGSDIPPTINIAGVETSGIAVEEWGNLNIPSAERNITVQFVGIDFSAPHQMMYKYRLKNSGEAWQFTNQRQVRYSSLLPGDYQFVVKARNSSGLWSQNAATLTFTVLAPFWFTWWFILLVIIVLVGLIAFIYNYYRVKKMVDIERMRVRIASDLHDDVGSSLTEIALQSDFLQTTDASNELKESVKQIGSQSRKIVSALDDIVWSIDARNDAIGDLTDRMQDYTNTVLTNREVKFHFEGLNMDEKLKVQRKENLYLIFKEAVNNIAKHSNASMVTVKLTVDVDNFELLVHDNGTKIKNQRKSGQGLHNMNMRAERIDASVIFINENGFTVKVQSE